MIICQLLDFLFRDALAGLFTLLGQTPAAQLVNSIIDQIESGICG